MKWPMPAARLEDAAAFEAEMHDGLPDALDDGLARVMGIERGGPRQSHS